MSATARDLMQTQVITVSPESPILDVQRLFFEEEIHGAPVVDETGRVVGVISTIDLIRAVTEEHDTGRADTTYLREVLEFSSPDWATAPQDFQDRLANRSAADVMTNGVVAVELDATVGDVARTIRENGVHRVLVLADGQLEGIISTFDLVGLLE